MLCDLRGAKKPSEQDLHGAHGEHSRSWALGKGNDVISPFGSLLGALRDLRGARKLRKRISTESHARLVVRLTSDARDKFREGRTEARLPRYAVSVSATHPRPPAHRAAGIPRFGFPRKPGLTYTMITASDVCRIILCSVWLPGRESYNDTHSHLNVTPMLGRIAPQHRRRCDRAVSSIRESAVPVRYRFASRDGRPTVRERGVAARHAQHESRARFDREGGLISAEAGITWPELFGTSVEQRGERFGWGIPRSRQARTG